MPRRARAWGGARGGGHPPYGVQGQREIGLSGRGGRAEREHGVALGPCGAGEHHLAVLLDHTLGEGDRSATGLPPPSMARSRGRTARDRRTRPTSRQVTSLAYDTTRAAS